MATLLENSIDVSMSIYNGIANTVAYESHQACIIVASGRLAGHDHTVSDETHFSFMHHGESEDTGTSVHWPEYDLQICR